MFDVVVCDTTCCVRLVGKPRNDASYPSRWAKFNTWKYLLVMYTVQRARGVMRE